MQWRLIRWVSVAVHLLSSSNNAEWTAEKEPPAFWETAEPRAWKDTGEMSEKESESLESTLEFCTALSNVTKKDQLDAVAELGKQQNEGMGTPMKISQTVILHVRSFYRHPKVAETCLLALRTVVWLDAEGQVEALRKGIPGKEPGIRTLLTLAHTHETKARVQEYFFSVLTTLLNGSPGDKDASNFEAKPFLLEPMKRFEQDVDLQKAAVVFLQVYIFRRPEIQASVIEEKVVPLLADIMVRYNETDLGRSGCIILVELGKLQIEKVVEGKSTKKSLGEEVRKDPRVRAAAIKVLLRQAYSSAPTALNALMLLHESKQGFKPLTAGLVKGALIAMEAHKMDDKYRDRLATFVCKVLNLDKPKRAMVEGELHRMTPEKAKDVAVVAAAACGVQANLGVWWLTVEFAAGEEDMKGEVSRQMKKLADIDGDGNITAEEIQLSQSWLKEPSKIMEKVTELSWFHQRNVPGQHDEL